MTTFAVVDPDGTAFAQFVQSSDAADLQARVNAAIAALIPTGRRITSITLAGAGDGHTYVVEIVSAFLPNIVGTGSLSPTMVQARCYMAADAFELPIQRARIVATGLPIGDEQIAGGSKGTRFMAMFLIGTAFNANNQAEGAIGNTEEQFTVTGINQYPGFTLLSPVAGGFVPGADNSPDFLLAPNGVFTYIGGVRRYGMVGQLSGTETNQSDGLIFLSIAVNGILAHGPPGFGRDTFENVAQDQLMALAYRELKSGDTIELAVAGNVAPPGTQDLNVTQASLLIH